MVHSVGRFGAAFDDPLCLLATCGGQILCADIKLDDYRCVPKAAYPSAVGRHWLRQQARCVRVDGAGRMLKHCTNVRHPPFRKGQRGPVQALFLLSKGEFSTI